ncbi:MULTISPECIES: NAD(P)-dependent oxidoreductase [unclassified Paenibacillus]|uniref:NAD-dependent epimerase/dehydratase family protein n=1 Tax=unclassified Paenibacillus TaxID=185978 RepID=UPI002404E2FD|nr:MULTISPECIES: NAD(P)-dependent oxidoreductase [unclassified Paenibacillus]MDF9844977.1 UDP-glucose 4-epimerase [Paenibacillus sp. PastF-2]MDF9851576.1 UDP-glucose 4-epimerase [Paenibacillus sp. PastM-2]MDF9858160.1 UDP-glucose 4-epimerase [Paenibacillus sp. PastF-1]MDH6483386.1 UDP-glucose 4-epimerase [Paenibacillus sp. PastH-2]MDH6510836.1 UDP-glucose 4-epimerase [Paenibacillus sp. PastM-3]
MRYIVTGAGGFIGSVLCEQLHKEGHEVVRMFRKLPGREKDANSSYEDYECNVLSEGFPGLHMSADAVIHLAAANDIVSKNGREGIRLSVIGTKNVLDFAVNSGIDKVVFFSTIQVLGSELRGLITEESAICPENDYAANHVMAEMYTEMYARMGLLRAVSVRPTNVYGRFINPTVNRWSLVPACFCREAFFNKQITLRSSGRQMRNFVSVDSVAGATRAVLAGFPASYDILHIGSQCQLSIVEAAQMVKEVHDELYPEPVKLIIQGEEPRKENKFEISLRKLEERYGLQKHLGRDELREQIRLIFGDLEQQLPSGGAI